MRTSDQIDQVAAASAKMQADLQGAEKNAVNPAFRSHYANLSSVFSAARVPLAKNGLTVWQDVISENGQVSVVTRLAHLSGQWIEFGPLAIPVNKQDAHGVGSATSYAKRYALSAALGIVTDDGDDDGNAAVTAAPPHNAPKAAQAKPTPSTPPADVPTKTVTTTITDVAVKEGEREGRKWKLYRITVDSGKTCSTFDTKIGDLALTLNGTGEPVKLTVKPSKDGKGFDVVALVPEMPTEPASADDDIPF